MAPRATPSSSGSRQRSGANGARTRFRHTFPPVSRAFRSPAYRRCCPRNQEVTVARDDVARRTPITKRADRGDERVRQIEEAVLLMRGEWPAAATGLCETVNRVAGPSLAPRGELDETIERTADEALR